MALIGLVAWLAAFVRSALAMPTASEIAVAREWHAQGRALQAEGHWGLASAKYRRALAIKETPGLRYLLGYCEERLDHLVEAGLEYQRASELIALGAQADDVASLLPHARARLKRTTPTLTVRLATIGADARLRLDSSWVLRESFGVPVLVNPGEHRLRIVAPGYEDFESALVLEAGARVTLEVRLVPKPF